MISPLQTVQVETERLLLIAWGNPARGDDGLGPALAERLADLPNVDIDVDYQLSVEHAFLLKDAPLVLFADARSNGDVAFTFDRCQADTNTSLASHGLTPAATLALAASLYDAQPTAWLLGVRGQAFGEVHEGLSDIARENLNQAEVFIRYWLHKQIYQSETVDHA